MGCINLSIKNMIKSNKWEIKEVKFSIGENQENQKLQIFDNSSYHFN